MPMIASFALPWNDFSQFLGWLFVAALFVGFGLLVAAWVRGSERRTSLKSGHLRDVVAAKGRGRGRPDQ